MGERPFGDGGGDTKNRGAMGTWDVINAWNIFTFYKERTFIYIIDELFKSLRENHRYYICEYIQ